MELRDNNDKDVKKGRLEAVSDIYDKDRINITWKQMPLKEKLEYYKEYYLKYTIIIIAILIIGIYVGYTIFKPEGPDTFYLAMMDGVQYEDSIIDTVPITFGEYLRNNNYNGYNSQEKMFFNTYYSTIVHQIEIDQFYDKAKFDIFISRTNTHESFARNHVLMNLEEVLPKELLESLSDRLVYTQAEFNDEPYPYGIRVENADYKFYTSTGIEIEDAIVSVVGNTTRQEAAIFYIRFLYGL